VKYDGDDKIEYGTASNQRVSCTVSKTVMKCICRERTASDEDASEPDNILGQYDPLLMDL